MHAWYRVFDEPNNISCPSGQQDDSFPWTSLGNDGSFSPRISASCLWVVLNINDCDLASMLQCWYVRLSVKWYFQELHCEVI